VHQEVYDEEIYNVGLKFAKSWKQKTDGYCGHMALITMRNLAIFGKTRNV